MKDNAKAELEAIVDMAMEWCKENGKNFLSVAVVGNAGMANLRSEDCDYRNISVFKEDEK